MIIITLRSQEVREFEGGSGGTLWGVDDPPGWVWAGHRGMVFYFPVGVVENVCVPMRPTKDDEETP